MKKILLGAFALCAVALYTACEKDSQLSDLQSSSLLAVDRGGGSDTTNLCMRGDTVDVSALPQAAADQIAADYPNATIQTVVEKHDGKAYAVELSDGTILIFKADGTLIGTCDDLPFGPHHGPGHPFDGGCLGGDTVTVADLAQTAVDYIAANYPNATIQTVVSKFDGKAFAVELSDGTVLVFKADGTFVGTCPGGPGNGPGHPFDGGCLGGDTLTVADLPQAAVDYVAATYPNATIQTVVSKFDGKAFAVELSDGTVLIFKADGTFVGTCPGGPGNGPGGGHSGGHQGGGHTGNGPGGGGPGGPHGGGGPGGHH